MGSDSTMRSAWTSVLIYGTCFGIGMIGLAIMSFSNTSNRQLALRIERSNIPRGPFVAGTDVEALFVLRNTNTTPIKIDRVVVSCDCIKPCKSTFTIPAQSAAELILKIEAL